MTLAARPSQPGDADPITDRHALDTVTDRLDHAHDLMARHQRQGRIRELAVDDVNVGPTHATDQHPDANLPHRWLRVRRVHRPQRLAGPLEHHRTHGSSVSSLSAGVPGHATAEAGVLGVSDAARAQVRCVAVPAPTA